jgi:hypothetical protein
VPDETAPTPIVDRPETPATGRPPLVAIGLIVLGALLLFGNLGWLPSRLFGTFWPVILIVIGIMQGRRRLQARA